MPSSPGDLQAVDFRSLFEATPGCYLVLAPDRPRFTIVAVNEAYLRATMTVRKQIVGRPLFDVFPDNPADVAATGTRNLRGSLEYVLDHARADTMAVQKYDIRRPEADGGGFEERYWSPLNTPVTDASGAVRWIVHRVEDVTEFVRLKHLGSAQELANAELRTRAGAMEVEIYQRAQEIQDANRLLKDLQAGLEKRVRERTAELEQANEALRAEIVRRHEAQEALQRSESQLRQSQKMEAIGRLAGGLAHDFNNLLCVILGNADRALERPPGDAGIRNDIAELRHAGTRAAELTRQLLAFSRQQVLEVRVLDMNDVLRRFQPMLRRLVREDIVLTLRLHEPLGAVRADRSQLEQVVMNLVVNSRDAMPDGGEIEITTRETTLDAADAATCPDARPGAFVELRVRDDGSGMDPATQAHIFEPFFSTKGLGRGTGLGLSTLFGIIQQLGGHIRVESAPGAGSTFRILLPRVDAAPTPDVPPRTTTARPVCTETILLAEDDADVRRLLADGLRRTGYTVLEAATPHAALELAERHDGTIHVLLSDVVMPEMNGRVLAGHVVKWRPSIRVLFMSGYTDDAVLQNGVLEPGYGFIQKPLTFETLRRKLRDLLAAPGPAQLA
ncbi:MAG: ATP-binding protein [Candidatus Eisenbacteria bacterium]